MYKIGLQMPSRVALAYTAKRQHKLCHKLDHGFESHLCLFTRCASTWIKKTGCYVKKSADATSEANLRNSLHTCDWECKRGIYSGFWNPGQTLSEVHYRGISGPRNRTDDFPKLLSKLVMTTKYIRNCVDLRSLSVFQFQYEKSKFYGI